MISPPKPLPMVTFTAAWAFVIVPSLTPATPPAVKLVSVPPTVPDTETLLIVPPVSFTPTSPPRIWPAVFASDVDVGEIDVLDCAAVVAEQPRGY